MRSDSRDAVEKCLDCRHGSNIRKNKIAAIEPSTLREPYENPAFVPSLTLDEIEPVLR
jgi:hypothetical protein